MQKIFNYILFLFFSCSLCGQPFPGKIGVNLDGIGGSALEFPNVTLTATAWQSIANSSSKATTDLQGWPTEDFRVVFFDHRPFNAWNNATDDPDKFVVDQSGTYSMSFKGKAVLSSWSDAPIVIQNQSYDSATNTTTLNIVFPPGGGANAATIGNYGFLMLNFNQTIYATGIKGVKEIRLMRPGYQHNNPQLFRTEYLNAFSPFSAIRFMNYLNINSSDSGYPKKQLWNNRQTLNAPRFTNGAPWEMVITLANYTAKDIWINIPVDADSLYVVELAKLINTTLRPEINIYLEYSNEVWNGGFTQYKYNYDAVLQSAEDADIRASTSFDDRRRARRVAKQIIKIGKTFETVMGITVASRSRLRPVFAWQLGGWLPWYDDVLNWINITYGPPKNFIYAIASAPYFGEGGAASNASPQQIVNTMSANSDANLTAIKTLAQYANQWQLKHLQYEGGPDNGGGSIVNIGNRIRANRIPEMKTAVLHNYKDNWFSANANGTAPLGTNDLVNYFVMSGRVSRYGCWGAVEDLKYIQNLSSAPKYDALCSLSGLCGNEPGIVITSPLNNTNITENTAVTISANASDIDGTVKRVEFFAGERLIGIDSIAPFSISWIPIQKGIVAILAKSIDNQGKYTFTNANVINVIPNPVGLRNEWIQNEMILSPVPAKDFLQITVAGIQVGNGTVEVKDFLGKIIISEPMSAQQKLLSLRELANGIYFLSLQTGSGYTETKRFIVQRQ